MKITYPTSNELYEFIEYINETYPEGFVKDYIYSNILHTNLKYGEGVIIQIATGKDYEYVFNNMNITLHFWCIDHEDIFIVINFNKIIRDNHCITPKERFLLSNIPKDTKIIRYLSDTGHNYNRVWHILNKSDKSTLCKDRTGNHKYSEVSIAGDQPKDLLCMRCHKILVERR